MVQGNMIYMVVGALLVLAAGLGYLLYQDSKQPDGVQINVGPGGVSIEEN
jgi:hypothetical protein